MALRVGYEKLTRETGWMPKVSWEEGVLQTIRVVRREPRPLDRPRRLDANRRGRPGRPLTEPPMQGRSSPAAAGFLGSHLGRAARARRARRLRRRGARLRPHVDGRHGPPVRGSARPELVFHLAAEVGGIGANRANPGRYWYANLMMGAHVLEQARLHETPKLVVAGTICAYPKFTPVPFHEDDLWNGYPEETNAPYGVAKKAILVGGAGLPRAVRARHRSSCCPANLYGPRDNFDPDRPPRDPGADPQDGRRRERGDDEIVLWGDGSPTREFLYVDDCAEGSSLAAERYDGAEPVNLGTGEEISIRDLAELDRRADRVRAARSSGTRRSRTASRAAGSTRRAPRSSSASARARAAARGARAHDRLVPRRLAMRG